jgi:hypothetical protein
MGPVDALHKKLIAREIAVAVAAGAISATVATLTGRRSQLEPFIALLTASRSLSPAGSNGFGVGVFLLDQRDRTVWTTVTYHNLTGVPAWAGIGGSCVDGLAIDDVSECVPPLERDGEIAGIVGPLTEPQVAALRQGRLRYSIKTSTAVRGEILGRILPARHAFDAAGAHSYATGDAPYPECLQPRLGSPTRKAASS